MSEMEIFVGTYKEYIGPDIEIKDEDDFYDLQKEHGCYYVKVNDQLYQVDPIDDLDIDAYGFNVVIPKQKDPMVFCYWYNGGAGLNEVVETAIKNHLNNDT